MAATLLWFGQCPSAGIILVKGYIAAEHSFGAGKRLLLALPPTVPGMGDALQPQSTPVLSGL